MDIGIEEILRSEGMYVGITQGVSMLPMMRERRDTITVTPLGGRAKKYDVVLYRREDKYIFHRVIKVLPDSYIIRGDNCKAKETGIDDSMLLGKLSSFHRGERQVKLDGLPYRLYCFYAVTFHPVRMLVRRVISALGRRIKRK